MTIHQVVIDNASGNRIVFRHPSSVERAAIGLRAIVMAREI
ncbi:hypothetical protein AB395_00001709 [Sinorhizobium fredii CCBAU 45436]|nr:hypothetical protein SF83666_c16700 [Sinorhizobium fredii CCBAU 83666]AWI57363.1 hypothetical protein AB395_00001709 [Sinorhizobium fredii CCBAU 45436]AWM25224.1 hypothetical protein AOX55_00001972 [Sinorhizobium fredii CCBAU 25509]